MTPAAEWVTRRGQGTPDALHARVLAYAVAEDGSPPEGLARASLTALRVTLAGPGDRAVALDLLAADALATLALQAQAEAAPADLADFARRLREAGSEVP